MEKFHLYTLILHVAGGTVAFITAPIAMIVRKGAKAHRFWGKAYFWAMTAVVISGIALSVMLSNIFLFCVAFFSCTVFQNNFPRLRFMVSFFLAFVGWLRRCQIRRL